MQPHLVGWLVGCLPCCRSSSRLTHLETRSHISVCSIALGPPLRLSLLRPLCTCACCHRDRRNTCLDWCGWIVRLSTSRSNQGLESFYSSGPRLGCLSIAQLKEATAQHAQQRSTTGWCPTELPLWKPPRGGPPASFRPPNHPILFRLFTLPPVKLIW